MELDSAIEPGKIFVGGLSWDTKEEGFKQYFKRYGEITDAKIMEDQATKKPRGFGFITFKDPASVQAVLAEPNHIIDNKKVDPKQATLKPSALSNKKVFIGGLPLDVKDEELIAAFSQFGAVTSVDIKWDKDSDKNRGFGFIDFDTEESAAKACHARYIPVRTKQVEIKKAEPRGKSRGMGSFVDPTPLYAPQSGYSAAYASMGRGYSGNASTSGTYGAPYGFYNTAAGYGYGATAYNQPPSAQYQYTASDYNAYRSGYSGQQTMTSYPQDGTGYAHARTGYGSGTEPYGSGGATGFNYDHTGYNYGDQMGGAAYTGGRNTTQQRSGFPYGRN